ncbi:hypothetical protein RUM44_008342 [Polyplax serrata]|uniref:Uncharacterized protein n=1 Tax=Polyplax serrata TaxID=468196 RepID=A0ABR1BA32_POLSC
MEHHKLFLNRRSGSLINADSPQQILNNETSQPEEEQNQSNNDTQATQDQNQHEPSASESDSDVDDHPKRTYQSLKNRFLRNIKPHLLTKFKYLIPDRASIDNILVKFPELQSAKGKSKTFKSVAPYRKPILTVNQNVSASAVTTPGKSQQHDSQTDIFLSGSKIADNFPEKVFNSIHRKPSQRRFEIINNEIVVTIDNTEKLALSESAFGNLSIYETYLWQKAKNKIQPCVVCGRGEPNLYHLDEDNADDLDETKIDEENDNENGSGSTEQENDKDREKETREATAPDDTGSPSREKNQNESPNLLRGTTEATSTMKKVPENKRPLEPSESDVDFIQTEYSLRKRSREKCRSNNDINDEEFFRAYERTLEKCRKLFHTTRPARKSRFRGQKKWPYDPSGKWNGHDGNEHGGETESKRSRPSKN